MRRPLRQRVSAITVTAALALSMAACSEAPSEGPGVIKIGISLPLTGDFSEPGKGIERGYQAWAAYMNANGGLLGRQIELVILDDQSSDVAVAQDYERLISQDKVDLVFGPFSTRLVVPAARVAQEYGYLFVEPAGAADAVFEQGFTNLFYAAPAVAHDHYNYLAEFIAQLPAYQRPKTAAYAVMDDPFAQGTAYGLKVRLEAMGVLTVADEVYAPDTTDFSVIGAKIADANADILVGGTQYQDAVNLILVLQQLNYQPRMAAFSTAPTNAEFPEAIGNKVEGILSPTGYTPEAKWPSNVEFVEFYRQRTGNLPGEDEANAWTTGQVVAAAVNAVGCADPSTECQSKLIDWLHNNTVDTVVGPLSWDEAGRPSGAHLIQQYVNGQIRIVLPEEAKEADIILVKPEW